LNAFSETISNQCIYADNKGTTSLERQTYGLVEMQISTKPIVVLMNEKSRGLLLGTDFLVPQFLKRNYDWNTTFPSPLDFSIHDLMFKS